MNHVVSSQQRPSRTQRECPNCHLELQVDPDYVTWCDRCGWNLQPDRIVRPSTLFESLYLSLGRRFSTRLFDEVKQTTSFAPKLTISKVLAITLAGLVHILTLTCAILGIVLLVRGVPYPVPTVAGLFCLLTAWVLRPRLGAPPKAAAPQSEFPTLYAITNRIAQTLDVGPIKHIIVDERFNAGFGQVGWRRQPVIWLGLPLLAILNAQERVALLAHEIAHGANGDPSRGLFVGAAIRSLIQWYRMLRPNRLDGMVTRGYGGSGCLVYISSMFANILLLGISVVPWLWAYGLSYLLWHESQRAEYLADMLATRLSGTEAMLSMLEKLHYVNAFQRTVREIALSQTPQHLVETLRRNVDKTPAREVERIRRVERLRLVSLDATHPPTEYRIEFLKAHPIEQPEFVLDAAEADQLEQELLRVQPRIQEKLINDYLSSLHR